MLDLNNFSAYFEVLAGITAAFAGIKSFREYLYASLNKKIAGLSKLKDRYEIEAKIIEGSSENNDIKAAGGPGRIADDPSVLGTYLKNLIKFEQQGLNYLLNLKCHLNVTFIYSSVYCVFILLLTGLENNLVTIAQEKQLLLFFNNILLMNFLIYIIALVKSKPIFNFYTYILGLIGLYAIVSVIAVGQSVQFSTKTLTIITLITPVSPFIFQLFIELFVTIAFAFPKRKYNSRLRAQLALRDKDLKIYSGSSPEK
jgi:hypothetical protein